MAAEQSARSKRRREPALRLELTAPEIAAMTKEQRREIVRILADMIVDHLWTNCDRSRQEPGDYRQQPGLIDTQTGS